MPESPKAPSKTDRKFLRSLLQPHAPLLLRASIQLEFGLLCHECVECFKLVGQDIYLAPEGEFVFSQVQLNLVGFL